MTIVATQAQKRETQPHGAEGGIQAKTIAIGLSAAAAFIVAIALVFVLVVPSLANTAAGGAYIPNGIAVIPIKGEITNDRASASESANDIVAMIDEAEKDSAVGAIFLDIDSPGGEVVASKQVVHRVRSSKKPVYSYINSVGASGAYYIASASRHVMADEDSITGSIGVISISFNLNGLLEKIGIKPSVLKVGKYKDLGSPFRDMTADENLIFQQILEQAYEGFRTDVLDFRGGKVTSIRLDAVADGRILTGKQAKAANLVDELMTRQEAIDRAAELSGIKSPNLIEYGNKGPSLYDLFFASGKSFGLGFVDSLHSQAVTAELK